jgi:hypothetical protein
MEGLADMPREQGTVHSVKDNYGFIKCYSKSDLVFYHINECDDHQQFQVGDEVDFLLVPDPSRNGGKDVKATSVRLVKSTTGIFSELSSNSIANSSGSGTLAGAKIVFHDKRDMLDWIKNMASKDGELLLLYIDQLDTLLNQVSVIFYCKILLFTRKFLCY